MAEVLREPLVSAPPSEVLSRPVTILIPAFGSAAKLELCLQSLAEHLPDAGCTVWVLDDATPDDSIRVACDHFKENGRLTLHYSRSDLNQGFVKTCNWGAAEYFDRSGDLLLLNSDTEATAGFLLEMQQILDLHEKHAVVTPRSNNATIFSVPFTGDRLGSEESYHLWLGIRPFLPRYQVMPTAVGFCMLIKGEALRRFSLFDEIYSPGYNEENDFVCRINRYGYSALAANRAFVFHHESSSFGSRRAVLEEVNRKTLITRYPEYERKVSHFFEYHVDPLEQFATLYSEHRPRILFDLFHLPPAHNGTSEFALKLLRSITQLAGDEFEIHVGVGSSLPTFESELRGYTTLTDEAPASLTFDLAFKPAQFFEWSDFERLNRRALRISFTLQDIIAVRCDYLNSPHKQFLFQKTSELSDYIFTISEFSREDANAFYGTGFPMQVIHHGTDLAGASGTRYTDEQYVLVVGNHYVHKGVEDALDYLGARYPIRTLGGTTIISERPNVKRLKSGHLTRQYVRQLFSDARVVVYPSSYEGFGLPILDSLALGKPVVALDTEVNRELLRMTESSRLYLLPSLDGVADIVHRLWEDQPNPSPVQESFRTWERAAAEYIEAFRAILTRPPDLGRLRDRWSFLRIVRSMHEQGR